MPPNVQIATASVPPALLAAAFDILARLPVEQQIQPSMIIAVSRHNGGDAAQSLALLVRIRAAAIVLRDPRWLPWAAYFKTCDRDAHCLFDAALLHIIATLPLTTALHFSCDDFFAALLARIAAQCRS